MTADLSPRAAAEILGVAEDAGDREIRAAFRDRAKVAHPDTTPPHVSATGRREHPAPNMAADAEVVPTVDELVLAREVLLARAKGSRVQPRNDRRRSSAYVDVPRDFDPGIAARPEGAGTVGRWLLLALAAGIVGIGAITIVLALAARGGPSVEVEDPPTDRDASCLAIDENAVASAVSCDESGAWQVVSRTSGIAACLPSMTRLQVENTTYCLTEAN